MDRDLVRTLSEAKHLPRDALRRAAAAPDAVAEPVLRVLEAAASGAEPSEQDANLLFWGLHALAAARDGRAHKPLMRLLGQDGETLDALLGDALTETLARVVASTFDGDAAPLEARILDSTTDDTTRSELLAALGFLAREGRIARAAARDLLARFDDKRVAVEGALGWAGWEETIAYLGLAELAPRARAAREDGRLTDAFSDAAWFRSTLRRVEARPDDASAFDPRRYGYLDDPVAALAWTAEGAGEPVRNPFKDVGRNDPCPCGSGRKFKKCCLAAAPA